MVANKLSFILGQAINANFVIGVTLYKFNGKILSKNALLFMHFKISKTFLYIYCVFLS